MPADEKPHVHPLAVQASIDHLADELRIAHMKLAEARGNLALLAALVREQDAELQELRDKDPDIC